MHDRRMKITIYSCLLCNKSIIHQKERNTLFYIDPNRVFEILTIHPIEPKLFYLKKGDKALQNYIHGGSLPKKGWELQQFLQTNMEEGILSKVAINKKSL